MMEFRLARRSDLPAIVALLADDALGQARETKDIAPYEAAFDRMEAAAMGGFFVGILDGSLAACYQLTFLYGLASQGSVRALLESVRVRGDLRSMGYGTQLVEDAVARAKAGGAEVLQLTTHHSRKRAHQFYERLGFTPSHIGYKRKLT